MNKIAYRAGQLLERQRAPLETLDSLDGLERWRDALVQEVDICYDADGSAPEQQAHRPGDMCADTQPESGKSSEQWEKLFAARLESMRAAGVLRSDADPAALATGLMAALQGGYLLAQTSGDITPMKVALDMAVDRVKTCARKS